ncbi:signal transduction histidine kinase, nitrogen specific, NtrB [Desulfobulbus propionicus DSM 2032]|jgi:signal transduction histidine kinase|uniref:histidine kinase n=1 Tax=Desulfobulbus propionicus (strain ATCC 33891 / DSM 2032 / VKM B-1956 / 1pr3) TaxID=577650 RepID=A0A7U4DN97_DESPD|nr:ATP-binding protein [Desulfobulbus propionicus]ADW16876.1 signal transduction histidine kinase, nitrogen specific, NtrB [Desulfobulbus propionicus DSM 2032]
MKPSKPSGVHRRIAQFNGQRGTVGRWIEWIRRNIRLKPVRLDFSLLWRRLRFRDEANALLPFELVKYFSFTSLLLILIASFILSWVIASNAKSVLLQRSEAYSRLFADNLNRQVFLQFVLPTVVRYGRIALSEQDQYERLDQIVANITRGMNIESVTIFEPVQNRVAYSTIPELMGKRDMGGLEYQKAAKGESNSVLISGGSLFSLLPGAAEVFCTLKTYVPFRQENKLGERTGEIMGVIEVVQDLSEDLEAIISLQARVIMLSLIIMSILFAILSMIVVRANRIMAERAEERLRLEEQLNEAQRLASLGKMVAAVSHEIKNPLGIVRSTAEILGNRISKVAPGNERLANIIVEETSRLDAIVREFLDFARPREVDKVPGSLNGVVERLLRFMEPEFQQKAVRLEVRLDPNLPEIPFDSEQIYQVLLNIVFNAIQAMPQGGDLLLNTMLEPGGGAVAVEVADSGIGIPPEKLEQIFTPFYTDKNRGTGLGLCIAKSIVEKHQGVIGVKSTPGEGSIFRVTLPVLV